MQKLALHQASLVLAALVLGGAGTELKAEYSRRNPIVEAVEKTEQGVVTLKVSHADSKKDVIGTGVIVDERGYVATNAHVVTEASRIRVTLHDGTVVLAEVLIEDQRLDLAILKLSVRKKLKALTFGPGSDLKRGETVIAIGNPFGFASTVSTGIISGLKREVTMPTGETLTNLTQHTAVLNPGNSGGPLLNINGELIGINVALRDGAQGIAFALNADDVQRWLSQHLSARKVARLGHGVAVREEVVKREGAGRQQVIVSGVEDRSAGARAGLKKGDVIVAVGDRSVTNRFDFERALWDCKPGEKVEAAVLRDGKQTRLELTLPGRTTPAKTSASQP
jgi:serine protease Do